MTLVSIFISLSLALLNLTSITLADSICSQATYSSLLTLSTYGPAESYCSQYFPQTKAKTTITVTTTSMTTVTTLIMRKRATKTKTTSTTTPFSTSTACTGACSDLASVTQSQGVPFQSTLCSCIESVPTKTVTKTVSLKTTATSKTKKTTTTTTPPPTTTTPSPTTTTPSATPTNEVNDGGFENGGVSWGFGGCAVDCNHPNSGSCELLFSPQPNSNTNAGQSLGTTPGISTLTFAMGYLGSPTTIYVPIFHAYLENNELISTYPCGDGNGGVTGCILDGNAHYRTFTLPYNITTTATDLSFFWTYNDPNASSTNSLTGLLDDVDLRLAS